MAELQSRLHTEKTVTLTKQLLTREKPLMHYLEYELPYIIEPSMPISTMQFLTNKGITTDIDTNHRQKTRRMIKTPAEITRMQNAVSLTQSIRQQIETLIKKDAITELTELQLRWMMIAYAMELWATDEAFPMIVASWAHSAIPHHRATNKQISQWPLLIDMGRVVDGYCSDMTRTYRVGDKQGNSPEWVSFTEFQKALTAVQKAHAYWCNWAVDGKSIAELSGEVREQLWELNQYFTHSLGHGVGVAVHEWPAVHTNSTSQFSKNMAITIEPWVYFPSKFGIRWEDIVFVA